MKLKNKFTKDGDFICGGIGTKGCGCDVDVGVVIRGYVYCLKCGKKLKGVKK